jgi:hypothetical protein
MGHEEEGQYPVALAVPKKELSLVRDLPIQKQQTISFWLSWRCESIKVC